VNVQGLKDSFARAAMHGDAVPLFFYADLFLRHPETRELFPVSMAAQRDRLVQALAAVVSNVDSLDQITGMVQALGRDHRKFGAQPEHYTAVGTSLLATLAHFNGEAWTAELARDWKTAYQLIAGIMLNAAQEDEYRRPATWQATVVAHELRTFDTAVFRLAVGEPISYLPGQYVSVTSDLRPRLWRMYSIANAPRPDGTMDFHVRMVDGGLLSMVLTRGLEVGSRLTLGPPTGVLTLDTTSGRDVLLVAGSTGLAPLKAILEQIAERSDPPRTHIFFGARTAEGLYDLPALEKMAARLPWLTVIPAVSAEPGYPGECGLLPDVVARSGNWLRHDAYICGPAAMVEATVARLTSVGVPLDQIHTEDFGWSEA
jgi:NAD(P)H-flavin reductase/hemoglobin-like flavoprotein